VDLHRALAI